MTCGHDHSTNISLQVSEGVGGTFEVVMASEAIVPSDISRAARVLR
jgi:hypothetical protein